MKPGHCTPGVWPPASQVEREGVRWPHTWPPCIQPVRTQTLCMMQHTTLPAPDRYNTALPMQAVHEVPGLAGLRQELQQELPGQLTRAMSHFAAHSTVQAALMEAAVPLLQLLLGPCSGSFEGVAQQCRRACVLQALQAAVGAYCVRCEAEGKEPEEEVLQAPQHFKCML